MKIERHSYSRSPWRLVTSQGAYVSVQERFDHPDLGPTIISGIICGETKAECVQRALDLLEAKLLAAKA